MAPLRYCMIVLLALFITSCVPQPSGPISNPMLACMSDVDCICGGILRESGDCFMGNKQWAEGKVDFGKDCPDFCTGIAGHLETKCLNNVCATVQRQQETTETPSTPPTECSTNADCVKTGCSGQLCLPTGKVQAKPMFTTCEYRDEYGCLKETSCGCIEGRCAWDVTPGYAACMERLNPAP